MNDILNYYKQPQRALWKYYRAPYYLYLNFVLRNKRFPESGEIQSDDSMEPQEVIEFIKEMDEMFKKVPPLQEPIAVYRGISMDSISSYIDIPQYVSTAKTIKPSIGFAGEECCILKITVPAGYKAIITETGEEEVILDRRLTIRVTDIKPAGNYMNRMIYNAIAVDEKNIVDADEFFNNIQKAVSDYNIIKDKLIAGVSDRTKALQVLLEAIVLNSELSNDDFVLVTNSLGLDENQILIIIANESIDSFEELEEFISKL